MIDRRKFLGRSVLSAGSVIFSSALLQSCTKYGIPLPGSGSGSDKPPSTPLRDSNFAWNDAPRAALISELDMIPVAGELLGALAVVYWSTTDPTRDVL